MHAENPPPEPQRSEIERVIREGKTVAHHLGKHVHKESSDLPPDVAANLGPAAHQMERGVPLGDVVDLLRSWNQRYESALIDLFASGYEAPDWMTED